MKVIVYNIFGLGHINPTLPLVTSLVNTGADVIYHSSPQRKELIEKTGARFCNYGRDDYKADDYNPGKNFVLQTLPATIGLLPFLKAEIEADKPDLILYDSMAPWGKVISQMYDIPSVCLVTTMVLSLAEKKKMLAQHGVVPDELNVSILETLDLNFEDVLGAYSDCNLVFSHEALNPPLSELNREFFHFIGSPDRLESKSEFPLLQNCERKKVITMALGTIVTVEDPSVVKWYQMVIEAFSSDERFRVILATGNENIKNKLGVLAPNTVALPHIPQLEVLKRTDVFIHHGGMNSISESISAGVPMLIIPHSNDQFTNARRVQDLGIGFELRSEDLEVETLKAKVLDLMFNPKIQNRIRTMKMSEVRKCPLEIVIGRVV